jgi:nucleotide-binding universal stress UspA family protein
MSFGAIVAIGLVVNLLCAILAAFLASRRGRDPFAWVLVCAVIGPFGLIALLGDLSRGREREAFPGPASGQPGAGSVVLLPVDGSESSLAAVDKVVDDAPGISRTILLTVLPSERGDSADYDAGSPQRQVLENEVESVTGEARRRLERANVAYATETRFGDPAEAILQLAREGRVDEIVMGRRGRGGVSKLLLGSVSEKVVKAAEVPVTVVG